MCAMADARSDAGRARRPPIGRWGWRCRDGDGPKREGCAADARRMPAETITIARDALMPLALPVAAAHAGCGMAGHATGSAIADRQPCRKL